LLVDYALLARRGIDRSPGRRHVSPSLFVIPVIFTYVDDAITALQRRRPVESYDKVLS
jgi:hypothetical protein